MKFIREAFFEVSKPDGAAAPTGGMKNYLKRHKFNFVRYGPTDDWYIEPASASVVYDIVDQSPVGEGTEEVFYDGIEVLNRYEATGFDDVRDGL